MKLQELIRLSNQLAGYTIKDVQQAADHQVKSIMHRADIPTVGIDDVFYQKLSVQGQVLQDSFELFEKELQKLKTEVQRQVDFEGTAWLQKSYAVYEKQLNNRDSQRPEAVGLHRNKPTQLDPELRQLFKNRVAFYCDWHYPAMIIHPMSETFIHDMIASDPLYIVDESQHLIQPTMLQFNEKYQQRLRPYVIEESFDRPILAQLPDQQFGFCLAYNYLNYRPFEIIKKYFDELYQKLSPGGVLAMTFNDCDRYQALQMVEQNITCYTPGSLIRGWAKYVGFEEVFCHQDEGPTVWLELKKPGQLESLRGGQCLAKILPKPVGKTASAPAVELTID